MPRGAKDIAIKGKDTRFKSGEKAAELGRKGGKRSQEVQKKRRERLKSSKILVQQMLSADIPDPKARKLLASRFGIDEDDVCSVYSIMFGVMNNITKKGNVSDLERLLRLGGLVEDESENDILAESNKSILNLAELINNPMPNRSIEGDVR